MEYEDGSVIGFIMAFLSLSPVFGIVAFVTMILLQRDLASMYFFAGQLVNEGFNFVLKRIFREARPGDVGNGFGMPSSHAQFVSFFTIYAILYMYKR